MGLLKSRKSILNIDWAAAFSSSDVDEMIKLFSKSSIDILSTHIPSKIIACNEKDKKDPLDDITAQKS